MFVLVCIFIIIHIHIYIYIYMHAYMFVCMYYVHAQVSQTISGMAILPNPKGNLNPTPLNH